MRNVIPILAALLIAATSPGVVLAGDDVPVPAPRVWAEPGDPVGPGTYGTWTAEVVDDYGHLAKSAEDWQILGHDRLSWLLHWYGDTEAGWCLDLRGRGHDGGRTGSGDYVLTATHPGRARYRLFYHDNEHFSDTTSETRYPMFTSPPALVPIPGLRFARGGLSAHLHLAPRANLDWGGSLQHWRGTRGSLLRQATGNAVPALARTGSWQRGLWLRGNWGKGHLQTSWSLGFQDHQGTRRLGDWRRIRDDRHVWSARGRVDWELSDDVRVFGLLAGSHLETSPQGENRGGRYAKCAEIDNGQGAAGLLLDLGPRTHLRLSGAVRASFADGVACREEGYIAALDRDLVAQDYRLVLTSRVLPRTRVRLSYRFRHAERDETLADADLRYPVGMTWAQTLDRTLDVHDVRFRGRTRLGGSWWLKTMAWYRHEDIDEDGDWRTPDGEPVLQRLGDRQRELLRGRAVLGGRLAGRLHLEAGGEYLDRDLDRSTPVVASTSWEAVRAVTRLRWPVHRRLTLLGEVSYGDEKVTLTGAPARDENWADISYEGETWRFAPGILLSLGKRLSCEGYYEGLRNRQSVHNDLDRWNLQARYRIGEQLSLTATFRRYEFDENRWDDYILDYYALSLTGRL